MVQSDLGRVAGRRVALLADGHVSFLSETINQDVLEKLTTRNGGEVVSADQY